MKHTISALLMLFFSTTLFAQTYRPVDAGSTVEFIIKNLGINTRGTFKGLAGAIHFDLADASKGSFDVSVDAATVNTDNDMRDNHLKNDSYFDVEKYPRIRMVSSSITGDRGHYTFNGKLTIKDKTQDISFPFTATRNGGGMLFVGSFPLNRRDFEVGGGSTISNKLTVNLTVYAPAVQ